MLAYDPNKRAPIGPGLYATPVPAPDVADRGWEIAVVDDGRGNWWVIVDDGLTVHTGATWKRESDALVDVDRMILWLLDMRRRGEELGHGRTCPNCGNRDPRLIQSNGEPPASKDLTLLCVARVTPDAWSFTDPPAPDEVGADGLVPCGMQWDPNS